MTEAQRRETGLLKAAQLIERRLGVRVMSYGMADNGRIAEFLFVQEVDIDEREWSEQLGREVFMARPAWLCVKR